MHSNSFHLCVWHAELAPLHQHCAVQGHSALHNTNTYTYTHERSRKKKEDSFPKTLTCNHASDDWRDVDEVHAIAIGGAQYLEHKMVYFWGNRSRLYTSLNGSMWSGCVVMVMVAVVAVEMMMVVVVVVMMMMCMVHCGLNEDVVLLVGLFEVVDQINEHLLVFLKDQTLRGSCNLIGNPEFLVVSSARITLVFCFDQNKLWQWELIHTDSFSSYQRPCSYNRWVWGSTQTLAAWGLLCCGPSAAECQSHLKSERPCHRKHSLFSRRAKQLPVHMGSWSGSGSFVCCGLVGWPVSLLILALYYYYCTDNNDFWEFPKEKSWK